jgi:ATP:corrinoid adenosyltransferase
MFTSRSFGLSHVYLDESQEDFSNFSVGLLIRALGHNLKIAYFDVNNSAKKFISFLENLSLSNFFNKEFQRVHIDVFNVSKNNKITRTILPLVEYHNIDKDYFFQVLKDYDLIIFDNFNVGEFFSNLDVKKTINEKNSFADIFYIVNNKKDFEKINAYFDFSYVYEIKKKRTLLTNKNLIYLYGDGRGKSLYSYGYIIRNYILKCDTKLIFFDKGDDIFGEFKFFSSLKNWSKMNSRFYGGFDFVITGYKRFIGPVYRNDILQIDIDEAKEGIVLLKTAIKKQTPIIADELGSVYNKEIISKEEIEGVLSLLKNELLITGDKNIDFLSNYANKIIKISKDKINENLDDDVGLKTGIDF